MSSDLVKAARQLVSASMPDAVSAITPQPQGRSDAATRCSASDRTAAAAGAQPPATSPPARLATVRPPPTVRPSTVLIVHALSFRDRNAIPADDRLAAPRFWTVSMQRFVRTVNHDIEAVSHAAIERCNNGLVEGQINRLKTLKRAMYARAGPGSRHFYIEIVRQMTKTRVSCSATPSASIG